MYDYRRVDPQLLPPPPEEERTTHTSPAPSSHAARPTDKRRARVGAASPGMAPLVIPIDRSPLAALRHQKASSPKPPRLDISRSALRGTSDGSGSGVPSKDSPGHDQGAVRWACELVWELVVHVHERLQPEEALHLLQTKLLQPHAVLDHAGMYMFRETSSATYFMLPHLP
ncbi:hypothetical protein T484DRAFT_1882809, partial [Baffinella frigidus]